MSGSTSKGEWKEPWHNGNMHNIEDFPSLLRLYPTILLLFFFTYSYIRPSMKDIKYKLENILMGKIITYILKFFKKGCVTRS